MFRHFPSKDAILEAVMQWVADRLLARIDKAAPVSYTHLRAHETVLDLVCRLLLEKKKYDVIPDNMNDM